MSISAAELAILREQTKSFIVADSKQLTLSRRVKTDNGSGGFTFEDIPMVFPQELRLIPLHGNMSPTRETPDGEAVQPDYILLGEFDSSIERWDTFTDNGRRYIVLFVHEKASYQKKGEVKYLGEA